ncbi:MAG: hypothetical protein JSR82_19825 [Verrucomicrobia bacterium]|nr:hypothetical protein [Verrucomicrobiota bacterium]
MPPSQNWEQVILTPVGPITPRNLENGRRLRGQRSEIAAALAAAGGSWGE